MSQGQSYQGSETAFSGKTTGEQKDEAATSLIQLAQQFAGETEGIRGDLIGLFQDILTTGGANLPVINQAVESSMQAGSRAAVQAEEGLAQSGLAGTPFGQMILASQKQQGEQAAGQTKTNILQQFLQLLPGFVQGQAGTAASGLSGAMGGNVEAESQTHNLTSQFSMGK